MTRLFLFLKTYYMRWLGNSAFYTPATGKSGEDGGIWHPTTFNPFSKAFGYAIYTKKSSSFLVPILLFSRYPSAIIFIIPFIIINSVYRKTFCRVSHISYKVFQSMPLFAYKDSSSAISTIRRMLFIFASTYHRSPCFSSLCSAKTMLIRPVFFGIAFHASTMSGSARNKRSIINWLYNAAITFTEKFEWFIAFRKLTNGNNKQLPPFGAYVF